MPNLSALARYEFVCAPFQLNFRFPNEANELIESVIIGIKAVHLQLQAREPIRQMLRELNNNESTETLSTLKS